MTLLTVNRDFAVVPQTETRKLAVGIINGASGYPRQEKNNILYTVNKKELSSILTYRPPLRGAAGGQLPGRMISDNLVVAEAKRLRARRFSRAARKAISKALAGGRLRQCNLHQGVMRRGHKSEWITRLFEEKVAGFIKAVPARA